MERHSPPTLEMTPVSDDENCLFVVPEQFEMWHSLCNYDSQLILNDDFKSSGDKSQNHSGTHVGQSHQYMCDGQAMTDTFAQRTVSVTSSLAAISLA